MKFIIFTIISIVKQTILDEATRKLQKESVFQSEQTI